MNSTRQAFETELAGKKIIFETGHFANQAAGACTVQYGGTVVLATAVMSKEIREGIDYFPLLVDYEERLYAAGKIKGSRFIKREGRPSDDAILTSRMVDRTIRPLFDETIRHDVQVVLTVLSVDQENDPDIISLIAASCALAISNIPWAGPIAGVRVGQINGEWVLNPTYEARVKSDLDLVIAGIDSKIIMLESSCQEITEDRITEAIIFGQKHLKKILEIIKEIQKKVGVEKEVIEFGELSGDEKTALEKLEKKVKDFSKDKIKEVFKIKSKNEHQEMLTKIKDELEEVLKNDNEVTKEQREQGIKMVDPLYEEEARRMVLEDNTRVDGRKTDEIRPISCEAGILPRTHGSGLFNRGETQVLSIITLGGPGEEQFLDTMEETGKKRFMHHYNFPGFSTGEVSPIRAPGRREIGHGALVEKAIMPLLPEKDKFPYTIRVVSEVLSSNGSTSQASCCGSSLALMDAGVPIKESVAGIAIGLITDKNNEKKYKILTDIQGVEDHNGDMDFKISGTKNGITAIQMDTKLHGLNMEVLEESLKVGKEARIEILEKMNKIIAKPRPELSPYAPRIYTLKIDTEKIRDVIGKGGETITKIIDECGGQDVIKIDIEDDGTVMITSHQADMAERAITWIKNLTHEVTIGEIYEGVVTKIVRDRKTNKEIGAIVKILPTHDGMVHISQFTDKRINNVSEVVKIGDKIKVKVMGIDKEKGRIELSHRALNSKVTSHLEVVKNQYKSKHRDNNNNKNYKRF